MVLRTFKLSLLFSCYWAASCMVYSYAERFLLHYGFTTGQIGLVIALAYLAAMILEPLLAQEADRGTRISLKSGVTACAAFAILLTLLTPVLKSVLPLLAVLFGAMTCVTLGMQPLGNAVGFHYINRGEPVDYSFSRGAASIAYALSSLLLGYLASKNIDSILWVYLAANVALFLVAVWFAPNRTEQTPQESKNSVFSVILKYPKLMLFCAGMLILNVPHVLINSYLASITNVTGGDMSIMIAIAAIVEFPAMMAYTHIRKRIDDRVLLLISACFYLLKTGLLALAAYFSVGTWAVYVSSATQMLCYAIFIPASSFFANDSVNREDQVKGQMLLTETTLCSGMISMLLGGLSIQKLGVPMTLLISEGFVLIGILIIAAAVKRKKTS